MPRGWLSLIVGLVALVMPASAGATTWTPVTGQTGIINEVGQVRSADGTLHVVWTRNGPSGGGTLAEVLHAAISPGGAVGSPTVIGSVAYASASNPAVVSTPGGGLEVYFGGIACVNMGCPEGLFSSTSTDGGTTWTVPSLVFADRDSASGSDMNAATLLDGTPFQTWWATLGVFVHRGDSASNGDNPFLPAPGAGCCGYESNLAADSGGHLQLAWDSNATGYQGVWTQAVDPTSGAPSGLPSLMPGSVTNYNGTPSHSQMLSRTPIIAQPGHPGVFYIAYPGGYPSTTKVLLWQVGSASPTTIVDEAGDHDAVSLAADATGRLWVFWTHSTSEGIHVFARRLGSSGLEPIIDLGAPAGAASIYHVDGSVDPNGDPEVLALAGFANNTSGTYYTRGPQTAPPLTTSIGKSTITPSAHKATFTFKPSAGGGAGGGGSAGAGAFVTGFQCALVHLSGHKKAPKPHFSSCKSPKTYKHLKHGKYIFEIRAVFTTGIGPVAKRRFKI
jgi:hypothetical protein